MFYIDLPLVILEKMKHHLRGHCAVLKGDLQTLGFQEFDSNVLIPALLHRHLLSCSETRADIWRSGRAETSE